MNKILHKIANPLYLLVWLGLSIFIALHHEPFSDEAQAYLIARDASFTEIIKNVARAEGHPLLWYLWLKIWLLFKIDYGYLSFASLIPSFLGVWLFVKKSPFPPLVRYFFPLTYFIFYQYNIVARGYSFLLLFISLAAIYYPKRKVHPWLYIIILMFLGQVEIYTFILAGGIFALGLYEDWKSKDINLLTLGIMVLYALLTMAMMFPNTDNGYLSNISIPQRIMVSIVRSFSCGLITFSGLEFKELFALIIGTTYFIVLFVELFNIYRKETVLLFMPVFLFLCYTYKPWHCGVIILIAMLILWLHPEKKLSKELKYGIILLFIVQLIWSTQGFIKEKNTKYSVGYDVYSFLVAQNIPLDRVYRLQFNTTSFCPYFRNKSCSYWEWNKHGFEREINRKHMDKYGAFVINEARYKVRTSFWDNNQRNFGLALKIFKSEQFIASYDIFADETLYVYYKESANDK